MTRLTYVAAFAVALSFAARAIAEEPQHHTFTAADGKKLHYATLGTQGSPVILIHGSGGNCETWLQNGIAASLAKTHKVYAIDMRGHGKSDGPRESGDMASDVITFMDTLKIDKAHIHGYSMGGGITGRLMARVPNRFITGSFGGSGVRETSEEWRTKVPPDKEGRDPQEAEASAVFNRRQQEARAAIDGPAPARGAQAGAAAGTPAAATPANAAATPANAAATPANAAGGQAATPRRTRAARGSDAAAAGATPAGSSAAAPARAAGPQLDLSTIKFPVMAVNGEFDSPNGKTHRLWRELPNFTNVVLPSKSHLTAVYPGFCPPLYVNSLTAFMNLNDPK